MSASDYTYLRRMRHVQNMPCNQYANTVVSCVPSTNYNHSGHVNYNYTPPPQCPPPQCPPPQCPPPCSSSHQHQHEHQHQHQHSGCDHCANPPPQPPQCNHQPLPQHHHYHGFPSPVSQPTINNHVNASCSCSVPYYPQPQICHTQAMNQHMMSAPACQPQYGGAPGGIPYGVGDVYSTTMNLYLITPTQCGTVNFIVDCGMSYAHGTKVSCESIDASGNSFEGIVYSYNSFTGEITIYDIKHINGTFNTPVRYSVMIRTAAKEFNLLRDRITALYKEVFNIDLTEPACGTGPVVDPGPGPGPGPVTGPTQAQATLVVNLFKYFFNQTISSDSDYALTETYLTAKLKHLYQYFFNVDITTNTTFNPNNNGVSLSTLNSKISQLYLYFFNNDLSSGSITIV